MAHGKGAKRMTDTQGKSQGSSHMIIKLSHVKKILKNMSKLRVSKDACIALSAAATYIISEILDGARNTASADNKKKISPKHINSAVSKDSELNHIGHNWIIKSGGLKSSSVVTHELAYKKGARD